MSSIQADMKERMTGTCGACNTKHNVGRHYSHDWKPVRQIMTLRHDIMVVAQTRIEDAWRAYIISTNADNHHDNGAVEDCVDRGAPLYSDVAIAMFPQFADIPYAR